MGRVRNLLAPLTLRKIRHAARAYQGAKLFPVQLLSLIQRVGYPGRPVQPIENFASGAHAEDAEDLGRLFDHYGSDKRKHGYNIAYGEILGTMGRWKSLSILEIGLGTNNIRLASNMGREGRPGASLRAFREFLPRSDVYGADVDTDILFSEDRIKTAYVDQTKPATFDPMTSELGIGEIDLVIDDGLHSVEANLNTLLFALPRLRLGGWVAIEDIGTTEPWQLASTLMATERSGFAGHLLRAHSAYLFLAQRVR